MILVSPPVHSSIIKVAERDLFSEIDQFNAMLSALAADGAIVVNDFDAPHIGSRNDFFYDSVHLNRKGSEAYAKVLAAKLREQATLQ